MQRCKDDFQREFYLKMTKKFGWTKDVLINQLEAGAFERYMVNQTNFDKAVPEKEVAGINLLMGYKEIEIYSPLEVANND